MIGAEIYGYRVERALSEDKGGFGEVYFARHTTSGAEAVLKVLKPEMSAHREIVTRFFNEARAAAAIQHPGIVAVHNVGYVQDRAYLLMERLRGEDLESRLRRGTPPIDQALRFLRQAAGAVGAAHERSIVHRDLKPANLFVVPDPDVVGGERIKVLDFGIAKLGTGGTMATQGVFGTPAYMSPEQCSSAADVDGRSDIYSLGCILYEMIAGRPPFGHGGLELIAAHLRDEPPPLRAFVQGVAPPIEALVARMLRKPREERPASCPALVGEIEAATQASSRPSAAHAATLNVPGPVRPSVPPPPPVRPSGSAPVAAPVPASAPASAPPPASMSAPMQATPAPVASWPPPPPPGWSPPPPSTAPGHAVPPASTTLGSAAGAYATRRAPGRTGIYVALGGVAVASVVAIVLVATRSKTPDSPAAVDSIAHDPSSSPPSGSALAVPPPDVSPPDAPPPDAEPSPAASPGETGIAECDAYFAKVDLYLACDQVSPAMKDQIRQSRDMMKGALADPGRVPDEAKRAAADGCKQTREAIEQAAAAVGCSLDLGDDGSGTPLDMSVVNDVYSRHAGDLAACMHSTSRASVAISIDGPSGRVTSVKVNGMTSGTLQACIASVLRGVQFPATTAARTRAEFDIDTGSATPPAAHHTAATHAAAPVASPATTGKCLDDVGCLLADHPPACCAQYAKH